MPWNVITDAVADLRILLSDGPLDKLAYRKRCIGDTNGTNLRFKTFEYRRVTNFTTPDPTLTVFINGNPATVSSDDTNSGEFVLTGPAPTNVQYVEATYYYKWFLDTDLQMFLKEATQWLGLGEDATKVPAGLQPAAKYFAAQEAYHKLAVRWSQRLSEVYKTEDAPAATQTKAAIDSFRQLALDAQKKSVILRNDYYQRQGQPLAPLFGVFAGQVADPQPKR